jgi:hypothetical protein
MEIMSGLIELKKASMRRRGPSQKNRFNKRGKKIAWMCAAIASKPAFRELIIPGGGGKPSVLVLSITN